MTIMICFSSCVMNVLVKRLHLTVNRYIMQFLIRVVKSFGLILVFIHTLFYPIIVFLRYSPLKIYRLLITFKCSLTLSKSCMIAWKKAGKVLMNYLKPLVCYHFLRFTGSAWYRSTFLFWLLLFLYLGLLILLIFFELFLKQRQQSLVELLINDGFDFSPFDLFLECLGRVCM